MKKHAVTLMLAAAFAASAHAETFSEKPHFDLVVMGKSWHFGNEVKGASYNDYNPGLGIEYRWPNGAFVGALTYYDSYRKQAYAAYAGYQLTHRINGDWSIFAAARVGYLNGSGFHGAAVMPTVGFQYKRLAIELEAIPKISHGTVNEIGVFARWEF